MAKQKRQFPKGSNITAWFLETPKAGNKPRIRREIRAPDGQRFTENCPLKNYSHLLGNQKELEDFVIRLNNKDPRVERIKDRLGFEHAFIGPEFLDEYQNEYLRRFIPSEQEARKLIWYLRHYGLNFFIGRLDLANPIEWKKAETKWGLALLCKQSKQEPAVFDDGNVRSAKVLKLIVYEMNRFMRFLHSKHPDIPAITFGPLAPAMLKHHEAQRKLKGQVRETKVISQSDWETIDQNLPKEWGAIIRLCYLYGLRRNEAYGLQSKDIRKGYLSIERQLDKIKNSTRSFKPLKSRSQRKTPHWFCEPVNAFKLVAELESIKLNSDSISHLFSDLCEKLKVPRYTVHDLRRTFITNCVKKGIPQEDLRLAVGHVDGSTTYKYYVQDTRDMENEIWLPDQAS